MLFRKRRRAPESPDSSESNAANQLKERVERLQAGRKAALALADGLVQRIGDFVVDAEEIDSRTFAHRLTQFRQRMQAADAEADPAALQRLSEDARFIADFSEAQSAYLAELEQELRHIVTLLTDAVVALDSENQQYHLSIGGKLDSLSAISRLNDLRQLKSDLGREIGEFRQLVRRKRNRESATLDKLSGEVENLRTELEQARDESLRDPLTGVFNRRAVEQHLAQLLEGGGLRRKRFAVAVIDIDNFKQINDHYGHGVGDRVLLAVTGVLNDAIRSEDFLGRLGGDEFVLVFHGANARNAEKAANKILQEVAATDYTFDDSDPDQHLSVTISIGVTERQTGDSIEDLLERADRAMYQAKSDGRNAVALHEAS
ncbi:MAG: GGDEF domain-containing protein [Wenzhouxiangellaceae bacterium]|nr:GGDEF domain-containing protein [Wenzhouxiangellaceae bacterium]